MKQHVLLAILLVLLASSCESRKYITIEARYANSSPAGWLVMGVDAWKGGPASAFSSYACKAKAEVFECRVEDVESTLGYTVQFSWLDVATKNYTSLGEYSFSKKNLPKILTLPKND